MLRDGKYAAWFRTSRGQGTGIVHLANGRISGSDSFFDYAGSYQVDHDRFTAILTTRRHAGDMTTVFGCDEVEVNVTGVCVGSMATCSGTARQAPELLFEATLIFSQEETPPADAKCAVVKLKADKLPKGLDSRSRSRSYPAPGPSRGPAS
jgi:hypothetical protein